MTARTVLKQMPVRPECGELLICERERCFTLLRILEMHTVASFHIFADCVGVQIKKTPIYWCPNEV
jgi:hypothetical protein